MTSSNGNSVPNQFVISIDNDSQYFSEQFQSYSSAIVRKIYDRKKNKTNIVLDKNYWDYSVTTGKYRNQFLNETKKETEAKIKSGEYKLVNLN